MFEEQEVRIRALVKKSSAPVLGLLGGLIPVSAREAIQADVRVAPSARSFSQRLDQYPALFGVWLAEHVMLGLGSSGHFDVYPHVQKALGGASDLSAADRELLWRAFRRAMFRLGIQPLARTFGTHYMIHEYTRQAGVPIAFAEDLASRMLQLARRLGLPDEDDQEGLLTWQSALLNRLQFPFSATARTAVERDTQAYYTRAFLRVYGSHGHPSDGDALEAALARAFAREGGGGNIKRAAIPQLLYRDGVLGVLFPPSTTSTTFELRSGDKTTTVRTDEQGGFRPLNADLPTDVQVRGSDGERLLSTRLWTDRLSNRLLVFNDAGRLRSSGQLGQDDVIELPPGQYIALCRFAPTNIEDWEEVSETPHLTEVMLTIRSGEELVIANGPAKVTLAGQNLPSFRLEGKAKAGLERVEFFFGQLMAVVEIPSDWRQSQQAYEVRVSCGESMCRLPVMLSAEGTALVSLQDGIQASGIKPGLRRLVVELARTGDARTLQRQSALYWVGLSSISYGLHFSYVARPENFIASACSGLKFSDSMAEPESDASRVLRIGFDVGSGRIVHLSWNRPGVFVEVEIPGDDGTATTVSRSLGATETVSPTTPKTIVVSASEPGFVCLGEWRQFVDFGHRPSKAFPAALLASRLEPGARTLTYETQSGGAAVPLLVLSQPHVVTAVSTSRLANVFEIRVTVRGAPSDVAVTGKELGTGLEARAEHELLAGTWHTNDLARMQVYSTANGSTHVIYVLIDVQTLPPGIWSIGFGARIGGLWGRLEDADEGRIAVAFAVDVVGQEVLGTEVVDGAKTLELHQVVQRLGRLNDHFRQFWSMVCWQQQSWLGSYWTALVHRLLEHESEFVTELVDMAMTRGADDIRQGFIAKQFVPALLPKIFCMPRSVYRKVNSKPNVLSVSLRAMPELKGSIVSAFGTTIHPAVVLSFSNAKEVMGMKRPRGFKLAAYRQAVAQSHIDGAYRLDDEHFLPEAGELLGPLHLAHAWRDLERGYAANISMPSARKSLAVALARSLHQKYSVFDEAAPVGLRGQAVVVHLKAFYPDSVDESEQQRQESLVRIANACGWLAWHCRLEARRAGQLSKLLVNLNLLRRRIEVPGNGVNDCIAYYLHVAPAMFAYYLLLWELVLTVELDPVVQNG